MALPDVVHPFKSSTTACYRHGVNQRRWPPFPGRLWQRGYYEHIVRDQEALNRIRAYIAANPCRWDRDPENPRRQGQDDFDRWLGSYGAAV